MNANPRILIVDDEPIVRCSYQRLLSGAQCRTLTASDGAEALNAMDREPFDVVLLDLRMPGEDGISVLRKIKAGWPSSEVVVITGYPSIESARQAVCAGASGGYTPILKRRVEGSIAAPITPQHRARRKSQRGPRSHRALSLQTHWSPTAFVRRRRPLRPDLEQSLGSRRRRQAQLLRSRKPGRRNAITA